MVETSASRPALPKGSCNSQIHVFGDEARYPVRHPNPLYPTPDGTITRALAVNAALGFERLVIVQATIYKNDHSLMFDVLSALPSDTVRGVAVLDETVSDAELQRMHDAGFRAARFNFQKKFGLVPSFDAFHKMFERIRALGWFAKVFVGPDELGEVAPELNKAKGTIVFDHMCRLDFDLGVGQPMFRLLLEQMKRDDRWVMLSNGQRSSTQAYPWDDAVPFGRSLYEAAPERCIWGTDWPHVGSPPGTVDDAQILQLFLRYLPDQQAVQRVLVDNPVRLFGFANP